MATVTPAQLRILAAIETWLKGALADIEFVRNDFSMADPGDIARVGMFDGDPGPAVETLLGFNAPKTYRHEIPFEITPRQSVAVEEIHAIHQRIKDLVKADPFLGGLVDFLEWTELANVPVPVSDARALTTGMASLIAEYTL